MLLLPLAACRAVDPAPAELDDLFHWFWQGYDASDDDTLADGLVNLDAAVGPLTESSDGALRHLSRDEAALVGVDRDPADAAGVFLLNAFPCEWDVLREILSFPDQDELYDGTYDAYARTFDAAVSRDAWLARDAPRLDYDVDYTATLLGGTYTARSRGALRTVAETATTAAGEFLAQRSFLPAPAEFEDGSSKSQDQDYQLELYWLRGGEVRHAYALWREADFGSGFTMDDEGTQRILLNGLLDWDDTTAGWCADGLP